MTIKVVSKTVLHCKCVWCNHEWDSFTKPKRCSKCKRYSWNGEDNRRRDPLEFVPPGSVIKDKLPEVSNKDVVETLMLTRGILEQIISDYGPCNHSADRVADAKETCVCHEKQVLEKVYHQIELLSRFSAGAAKYERVGAGIKVMAKTRDATRIHFRNPERRQEFAIPQQP